MTLNSIDAKPILLSDLLDSIENGTAVLPAFQRDFDWSDSDVVSLLATLLCNWPAGSLLLMTGKPDFFEVRSFEDGPELADTIRYVVLDGQQRLTALYRALRERGDAVFVLDAKALSATEGNAEDLEEAIALISRSKWRSDYPPVRQGREGLIPLYVLRSASDFFAWRDQVVDSVSESERSSVGRLFADIYRSHLGRLNTYSFPSVVLENDLPPAAVARIFERINRTGLRLSTFDLLVARVYEPDWNLRDRWDTARRESEAISYWLGNDGLPVVQAISLNLEGDIRQPALLNLKPRDIRHTWDPAVEAVEAAINELRLFGVPSPRWMPYRGLMLPLANRAMVLGGTGLESARAELQSWFWGRSFSMNYDVGSSTRISADAKLLSSESLTWHEGEFSVDRSLILNATRKRQSTLWASFLSLLSSRDPRDLLTGEPFGNAFEDAVPVSLIPRTSDGSEGHLKVLGMVLLTRDSAGKLRRDRTATLSNFDELALQSQLVPTAIGELALSDQTAFLENRMNLVEDYLTELLGQSIHWFDSQESQD